MPRRAPSPHPKPQRGDGVPVAASVCRAATGPLIIKSVAEVITALQAQLDKCEACGEKRNLISKLREHFPEEPPSPIPTTPSPKPKHGGGRPIINRDDGKEAFRARKRQNAAARRARLRAQAATAAEAKPQTDNDNVMKAAVPAEPKPKKPSKATEFQQWREQRNDTPVLDNSLVAS